MAFSNPIAAATSGIQFGRLSSEDVRKLSVRRIHVTPTLDSMFGPMPGGVHDLALGAINVLDASCTTCRMTAANCPGHCGHIELPTQCYHPQYIDTALRLLRAKCAYCHRFKLPENLLHMVECQLKLLHHGLLDDYFELARFKLGAKRKRSEEDTTVEPEEEDVEDLLAKRERFVEKAIKKAKRHSERITPLAKNTLAIQQRKQVITAFLQEASLIKKCTSCSGVTPSYRKDRAVKIFRLPLSEKARDTMSALDLKAPNPLIYLMNLRKQQQQTAKAMVNGDKDKDVEMTDGSHGAEEEIALRNALDTTAASKEVDIEGGFETQAYMTPAEVHAALTLLFEKEQTIVDLLFAPFPGQKAFRVDADMFFMTTVLVTPNKFRPLAKQGPNQMMEAQMNAPLNKVINASNILRNMMKASKRDDTDSRKPTHAQLMQSGIVLQETVNALIDNPQPAAGGQVDQGIKQILEKKEGLFRMNMMGKRVNFAARSVISPDPNIETNEIGVPLVFAKKLTYPEPLSSWNLSWLQKLVVNGADKYPGAVAIENENGQVMSLKRKTREARQSLAKQLNTPTPGSRGESVKKVYRHLMTGDMVIMNRQPTLHKPSMMGHKARVLKNEKTIRMHYANCNTYNADFDGDEMNMRFPQNPQGQTEARMIANTDNQYLSATAGKPLRGLIQDHISMGVQFTSRDVFFTKAEYNELIYHCLRPEHGHTTSGTIKLPVPAICKPFPRWTGKQVITTVLLNIIPEGSQGINLTSRSQTTADRWGEKTLSPNDESQPGVTSEGVWHRDTEQNVIFQDGELLLGILDKAQLGPAVGGLVHSCYEIYGPEVAGKLLSVLGRLLTRYLSERAWSCGIDDLYLTPEGDNIRRAALSVAPRVGHEVSVGYVQLDLEKTKQGGRELSSRLEDVSRNDDQLNTLDQLYNASTKTITDAVSSGLQKGLRKPFPRNQMQAMTISGAKGSGVNANLISCNLGQQVLEGRRVPVMVSGKTLPLYRAFETHPTAGGYITGRFLTGIKPPEYYFHAMSGREGLIDTAVKTAKSGYLQRCIIKGLEGLRTEYDTSVRESSNGSVVQFLYGEDGLEVTKQRHLKEFSFIVENQAAISHTIDAQAGVEACGISRNTQEAAHKTYKKAKKYPDIDPITAHYPPANYYGSTSEAFTAAVNKYVKTNPDGLLIEKDMSEQALKKAIFSAKDFKRLIDMKYMRSVIDAGEAIGVVAAQSVGEPSTQMTLNTFHLAGHSAKNVTLGIPRLREIIMTASPNLMTPTMTIKPIEELSEDDGRKFAKSISKLPLSHVIDKMSITESTSGDSREYEIRIEFFDPKEYTEEYAIQIEDVSLAIETKFLPLLDKLIKREFKKKEKEGSRSEATAAVPEIGASVGTVEQERPQGTRTVDREAGEDDIDSDADPDDAKDAAARGRRVDDFDEPDDEEAVLEQSSDEEDEGDEKMTDEQKVRKRKNISQTLKEQNPDEAENSDMDTEDNDTDEETSRAAREKLIKDIMSSLKRYDFSRRKGRKCKFTLQYEAAAPKLLLLPILERAAHAAVVQSIPGLDMCTLYMEDIPGTDEKEAVIATQGVNMMAMRQYQDIINPHTLYTNSVHEMLALYGVEAARMTIIKEIDGVFKGHGISVDNRHINLIADAMTQSGSYQPFSRHGLVKESGSVLSKMSFETVMGFLKEAVMFGESDNLLGPSARIVAGRRGLVGTGSFDVVMPV